MGERELIEPHPGDKRYQRRKDGRTHVIRLRAEPLAEAEKWLKQWEKFWTVRLDRLQALVEADARKKAKRK